MFVLNVLTAVPFKYYTQQSLIFIPKVLYIC